MLKTTPLSIRVYVSEICKRLPAHAIAPIVFDKPDHLPEVDVFWDPRTGGGRAPTAQLADASPPLVVTLHDVAHLSLPMREFHPSLWKGLRAHVDGRRVVREWGRTSKKVQSIICPSTTTLSESRRYLKLPVEKFAMIPHGVDHDAFAHSSRGKEQPRLGTEVGPYFLHVSHYQPRKNIDRILQAYEMLPAADRPGLVMKVYGYPGTIGVPGVRLISGEVDREQIVQLFRGALAFVFPSLHEGFGLPVLEAMAAGCPVITSTNTSCSEVTADCALHVDPRSTEAIAMAMMRLWKNQQLRQQLSAKGALRSCDFSWSGSTAAHASVFRRVAADDLRNHFSLHRSEPRTHST